MEDKLLIIRGLIMSEDFLKSIDKKLGVIIKLLVSKSFQEQTQQDTILELKTMWLDNNFIADILCIKSNIVRAAVSTARKKRKKK